MRPHDEPPAWFGPMLLALFGWLSAALGMAVAGGEWWWPFTVACFLFSGILIGGLVDRRRRGR
jgi:uncharacterized membrane protein